MSQELRETYESLARVAEQNNAAIETVSTCALLGAIAEIAEALRDLVQLAKTDRPADRSHLVNVRRELTAITDSQRNQINQLRGEIVGVTQTQQNQEDRISTALDSVQSVINQLGEQATLIVALQQKIEQS